MDIVSGQSSIHRMGIGAAFFHIGLNGQYGFRPQPSRFVLP
jgi:hypothetical protein